MSGREHWPVTVTAEFVTVREFLEALIHHEAAERIEHQTGHEKVHDMMALALGKADEAMTARLESMNQFRAQIQSERGSFLLREAFEAWVKANDMRREELLTAQRQRDEKHTQEIADVRATVRGYIIAGGVIFAFLNLLLKFVPIGFGLGAGT